MDLHERKILEALDKAVGSARSTIDPMVVSVDRRLRDRPADVLAWQAIPLDVYRTPLPKGIHSSWVFVLRANVATGAERHPNSHQRMMSYRGRGDWCSHHMRSDPGAALEQRWISIEKGVWNKGV